MYAAIEGAFLPRVLGWEDGARPLLVLEDLSPGAHWPPPWRHGDVDLVLAALREVAAAPVHGAAAAARGRLDRRLARGRARSGAVSRSRARLAAVARGCAPGARRRLGQRRRSTVTRCCTATFASDNLCLRDGRAIIFDWSHGADRQSGVRRRVLAAEPRARGRPAAGCVRCRRLRRRTSPASSRGSPACRRRRARRGARVSSARSSRSRSRGRARVLGLARDARRSRHLEESRSRGRPRGRRPRRAAARADRARRAERRRQVDAASAARRRRHAGSRHDPERTGAAVGYLPQERDPLAGRDAARVSRAARRHRRARAADGRARRATRATSPSRPTRTPRRSTRFSHAAAAISKRARSRCSPSSASTPSSTGR